MSVVHRELDLLLLFRIMRLKFNFRNSLEYSSFLVPNLTIISISFYKMYINGLLGTLPFVSYLKLA